MKIDACETSTPLWYNSVQYSTVQDSWLEMSTGKRPTWARTSHNQILLRWGILAKNLSVRISHVFLNEQTFNLVSCVMQPDRNIKYQYTLWKYSCAVCGITTRVRYISLSSSSFSRQLIRFIMRSVDYTYCSNGIGSTNPSFGTDQHRNTTYPRQECSQKKCGVTSSKPACAS